MLSRTRARCVALLPWVVSLSAHAAVLAAALTLVVPGGGERGAREAGLTVIALPSDARTRTPLPAPSGAATRVPPPAQAATLQRHPSRDRSFAGAGATVLPVASAPDAPEHLALAAPGDVAPVPPEPARPSPVNPDQASGPAAGLLRGEVGAAPPSSAEGPALPMRLAVAEPAPPRSPLRAARYLETSIPPYPDAARRAGREGLVQLRARISAEGQPESVQVLHSSGSADLDAAARQEVSRWRFDPARRGDEAIASWMDIPVRFSLRAEP